jgi:hypothetical protein
MNEELLKKFKIDVKENFVLDSSKKYLGFKVVLNIENSIISAFKNLAFTHNTKRGFEVVIKDFSEYENGVSFFVYFDISKFEKFFNLIFSNKIRIATTFFDFCNILASGSSVESIYSINENILVKENAEAGDLTIVVPSKVADDLIDILAIVNDAILDGLMEDSVIVGTFIFEGGSKNE